MDAARSWVDSQPTIKSVNCWKLLRALDTTRARERLKKDRDWTISSQRTMLNKQIIQQIQSGQINSRRQLYRRVGRSKKLLQWLNDNQILISNKWDKGRVKAALLSLEKELGRTPKAHDNPNLTKYAQTYFGGWNQALQEVFGIVNQRRCAHLSDEHLLNLLTKYIKTNTRLPLREEFNGSTDTYPYWEVYVSRFNLPRWSSVFSLLDLSKVSYYSHHGYGKIRVAHGNTYLSHQEYLIGKYLTEQKIKFEKEVPYGNSNHVFDFYLPTLNAYIEYYGIGTKEYQARVLEKRKYYQDRHVIEIFKHDNTIAKLDFEVQRL